ncbi:hypothetical protein [Dokdonella sp.]|uniref:hypothetical protein n=1 Tax=Dokdonella sp. TaxID=2291710 RepID=UPI001B1AB080|nr:hypothetical protein [Dokdonella sp.]MBO9661450.1 hypothetical protein [Dokdonella sp.]
MDKLALKSAAEKFERELAKIGGDPEAVSLRAATLPLIDAAKAGRIEAPLQWREIPGARLFSEGNLRRYGDLEGAYSAFRVELTGGESDTLRALKASMPSH